MSNKKNIDNSSSANKNISKGHLIDEYCKYKDCTLISKDEDVYSCILNQTDIKSNKNKFYIMQLIKCSGINEYIHYIRYGRIGEVGKTSYNKYGVESVAINAFEKQFRSKTGNSWYNRKNFIKKPRKYFMSEIGYEEELKNIEESPNNFPKSKLNNKVQELIKMISDIDMMKNTLVQLDIDIKKMPLGKLKQNQLDKAKEILDQINDLLNEINKNTSNKLKTEKLNNEIIELSSKYYTYIPYACGRKKPPLIYDKDIIGKYTNVIQDLSNIVVTTKILQKNTSNINPIDSVYNNLNAIIKPLKKNTKMYKVLTEYFYNSHAPTHSFKLELIDIYQIQRNGKEEIFKEKVKELGNVQLLIHGSRMCNWCSIITKGLILDSSKLGVYISGRMFSTGIYFANSFSKSAQYCGAYGEKNTICLALAEVALGKEAKRQNADYYASLTIKKENCDSCWGQGQMAPESHVIIKGVKIPNGKLKKTEINSVLRYDEKIVYDTDQFMIKYLVIAKMSY